MRENTMKQLGIIILVVGIVVGFYSQSITGVYAQGTSTPTSHCHWWDPFCHRNSTPPGYGQVPGYGQTPGYGQSPCSNYPYCSSNPSYNNQYPSNCVNYACSYPSTPAYQYPSSSYPYQYQVQVSVPGQLIPSSTGAGLIPTSDGGCWITLVSSSVYLGQYANQYVTVNGLATTTGATGCPYTTISVSSIVPLYQQQPQVVQQVAPTTTQVSTTTVTASPTTTTTQALAIQPTTDYTPIVLVGLFVLLGIGLVGFFVYMMRRPSGVQYATAPEPKVFCLSCSAQLPNRQTKFCSNCGAATNQ
jgi:hypothetical protein